MDAILIIAIVLLLIALLGVGGVVGTPGSIAWLLLVAALAIIAWRVIAARGTGPGSGRVGRMW